jgi:hypothetical protein
MHGIASANEYKSDTHRLGNPCKDVVVALSVACFFFLTTMKSTSVPVRRRHKMPIPIAIISNTLTSFMKCIPHAHNFFECVLL